MKKKFIKDNLHFFQLLRFRSLVLLCLFCMCIDIEYKTFPTLIIPTTTCIIYILDSYKEYKIIKKPKIFNSLIQIIKYVLPISITTYLNIVIMNEIVLVTGFSYNNFSSSFYILFITTICILSIPISLIFVLLLSFLYEIKFLLFSSKKITKKNLIKLIHYLLMFFMPILFSINIFEKTEYIIKSKSFKFFQNILVYSSYTSIPNRCNNKLDLESRFQNIQIAFLDDEKMSIVYEKDGTLFFNSALCKYRHIPE